MEDTMRNVWNAFWTDESGQDLAEYALLIALIAVIVVVALPPVGQAIKLTFEKISGKLDNSNAAGQ
jgi:pilus assembly protein Flp/PilA